MDTTLGTIVELVHLLMWLVLNWNFITQALSTLSVYT